MSVVVVTEARLAALVLGREPFVTGQHLLCPLPTGLYVLVGAGALMMAVGFFGCCGARMQDSAGFGDLGWFVKCSQCVPSWAEYPPRLHVSVFSCASY